MFSIKFSLSPLVSADPPFPPPMLPQLDVFMIWRVFLVLLFVLQIIGSFFSLTPHPFFSGHPSHEVPGGIPGEAKDVSNFFDVKTSLVWT